MTDQASPDGFPCLGLEQGVTLYLRTLGASVTKDVLWRGLPVGEDGATDALLVRALQRIGFDYVDKRHKDLAKMPVPCLINLGDKGYALVVDGDAETLTLVDPAKGGLRVPVKLAEIVPHYTGRIMKLHQRLDAVAVKHLGPSQKKHWFWGRVFGHPRRFAAVVLASLFANMIAVAVSLFALQVYDRVIPNQSHATLWVLAIGAAVAVFFELTLKTARSHLIDDTGREVENEVNREIFEKFQGMRLDKRPAEPGILVSLVNQFSGVREFFGTATVGAFADIPFTLIFFVLIYTIGGPVIWIILTAAVLMVLPSLLFQGKMVRLANETQGGSAAASRLLTEVSYGHESVKAARLEPWLTRGWEELMTLNAEKSSAQRTLAAGLTYWSAAMQQFAYLGAIIGGVYLLFSGDFTAGSIIALSILTSRTLAPYTQLASILTRWQNMKVSLKALDNIMTTEQDHDAERHYVQKDRFDGHLELRKAGLTFGQAKKPSCYAEGLRIAPGTRLALIGPNGSGKTSLLRVLSGIYVPTEGEYLIDGIDALQLSPAQMRKNIGYLPQEVRLFRGSLRENLMPPFEPRSDDDLMTALDFAGLGSFVRGSEMGLDLPIQDGGSGLSTGQKVSVGLARLFLQDPAVVLMDEPTAALDQNSEMAFIAKFDKWLGNRTCVVATHRTPLLSKINRVAVMKDGIVIAEGARDDILSKIRAVA